MLIKCYDVGIPFTFVSVLMQTLIVLCRGLRSLYSGSAHMHIISIELSEIGLSQRINERGLAVFLKSSGCKSWRWCVLTLCSVHGKEHSWRVSSLRCGCWKDSLFLIELPHSFVKHHFTICWPISGPSLLFHWTICLSFHQFHTTLFFLLKITSAILDPLLFHINFRISTSISTYVKKKKKKRKKVKKWKPVSLLGSWLKLCSFNRLSIGE